MMEDVVWATNGEKEYYAAPLFLPQGSPLSSCRRDSPLSSSRVPLSLTSPTQQLTKHSIMMSLRTAIVTARAVVNQTKAAAISVVDFPLITQSTLIILIVISPITNNWLSLFDSHFFGSCFNKTVQNVELYRLVTDPLLSTAASGLQIPYVMEHFGAMEKRLGSASFLVLFVTLCFSINILHLLVCYLFWKSTGNGDYLWNTSSSIWTVLLAMMVIRCSSHVENSVEAHTQQRVRQQVMLLLFSQLNISMPNMLGVAVGCMFGRLEYWKLNVETVQKWEDDNRNGWLSRLASSQRYIAIVDCETAKEEGRLSIGMISSNV